MPQSPGDHYYPDSDAEFTVWGDQFIAYVQAHFAEVGLSPGEVLGLNADWTSFQIAYKALVKVRAEEAAALETKVEARRRFVALMRPAVRQIQTFPGTTDAHRGNLGITIPDRIRTPVVAPTSRPLVKVDFSKRLLHRIGFVDEKTPTRRARPRGVTGAEVWVKVAASGEPPPTGPGDLSFLMLSSRSPAVAEYGGADAGKTAHYMLRWHSGRGEPGPWSETASATIGA